MSRAASRGSAVGDALDALCARRGGDSGAAELAGLAERGFRRGSRRTGRVTAEEAHDFCVKPVVEGLRPGRWYYYRFRDAAGALVAGRADADAAGRAGAGASGSGSSPARTCASAGSTLMRHAAARRDIDLIVHVGDYLYEYQEGRYPDAGRGAAGADRSCRRPRSSGSPTTGCATPPIAPIRICSGSTRCSR